MRGLYGIKSRIAGELESFKAPHKLFWFCWKRYQIKRDRLLGSFRLKSGTPGSFEESACSDMRRVSGFCIPSLETLLNLSLLQP